MSEQTTARLRRYYDQESSRYDETRGGQVRAARAADAFAALLGGPAALPGPVIEVGAGTGSVSSALRAKGFTVVAADFSIGMLRFAQRRLPGAVIQCAAQRLPIADRTCGAVVLSWLLHLVDDPRQVLTQAARVLGPGGRLVTTVDKQAAMQRAVDPAGTSAATSVGGSDPAQPAGLAGDDSARVDRWCRELGMRPIGQTRYDGIGQPGTPSYQVMGWALTGSPMADPNSQV